MTNDAVIEALEHLRTDQSQRLRAVNTVLATLKGATGALTKANRALTDYTTLLSANGAGDADSALTRARQHLDGLHLREEVVDPLAPALRREARALTGLVAALRAALTALQAEPVDVIRLGRSVAALRAVRTPDTALGALLPALDQALAEGERHLGDEFGVGLRQAVAATGLELGGRPPRFEIGRFEIVANFVSRKATISYGKEELSRTVPLSVEAVMRAYQAAAKTIAGRNEDPDRWMAQLQEAYNRARSHRSTAEQRPGTRANIIACLFELVLLRQGRGFRSAPSKHAFVDYSRAQFAYDFAALADRRRVIAHVATKSQADSAERSLWLVEGAGPHDGAYIADIEIV
ncbi:MAG: hypothetical protein IT340_07905 [Chloroflexi bacterium]|nr:hypothetical protein [Chloroflexota bacterium]